MRGISFLATANISFISCESNVYWEVFDCTQTVWVLECYNVIEFHGRVDNVNSMHVELDIVVPFIPGITIILG